jgi:hypothetical protein
VVTPGIYVNSIVHVPGSERRTAGTSEKVA